MTVSLTTRGRICPKSSKTLALLSWGFLCIDVRPFVLDDVGFIVGDQPPAKQVIYNKEAPPLYDPQQAGLFVTPSATLAGRKSPILRGAKTASTACSRATGQEETGLKLLNPTSPGLYNHKVVQLTGAKVVRAVGDKKVLLSEPEEPTLTSSGTRVPEIFDKC